MRGVEVRRVGHPLEAGRPVPWATRWGFDAMGFGVFADLVVAGVSYRMRWLPPGRFGMGSPPEEEGRDGDETLHAVILTRGFWLGETAVTQAFWDAVMAEGPPEEREGDEGRLPVTGVSHGMITRDFLPRLEAKTLSEAEDGRVWRLPTEAEWEYACRAGTTTAFSFGDVIGPEKVHFSGSPGSGALAVRSLPPNPWGFFEMHGNVWEWCLDWYGAYPPGRVTDPRGPESGLARVLRGGSWVNSARGCRSASRYDGLDPVYRSGNVGFRLSRGPGWGGRKAPERSPEA